MDEILEELDRLEREAAKKYLIEMQKALDELRNELLSTDELTPSILASIGEMLRKHAQTIAKKQQFNVESAIDLGVRSTKLKMPLKAQPGDDYTKQVIQQIQLNTEQFLQKAKTQAISIRMIEGGPESYAKRFYQNKIEKLLNLNTEGQISAAQAELGIREELVKSKRYAHVMSAVKSEELAGRSGADLKFEYYASPLIIKNTRAFCQQHAGQVKTWAEWTAILQSNGGAWTALGGVRCRHDLVLVT